MRYLFRLALRNLWIRKTRTVLTTLGIVLGVAAIVSIAITRQSAIDSVDNVFREVAGDADITISNAVEEEAFKQRILTKVQDLPDVKRAAPLIRLLTLPTSEVDNWQLDGAILFTGMTLYGLDPALEKAPVSHSSSPASSYEDDAVHPYRLSAGRPLEEAGREKFPILLGETYAAELELEVGDHLEVIAPEGTARFTIVGLLAQEGLAAANQGQVAIAPLKAVQTAYDLRRQVHQIDVVLRQGTDADLARRLLADQLGPEYSVTFPAAKGTMVGRVLEYFEISMGLLGVLALFAGAFLIYNTFAMTVVERTREHGLIRSLGVTSGQIMALLLAEALLLGGFGSTLGLFLGPGLAYFSRGVLEELVRDDLRSFTLSPGQFIPGLLTGLSVTLVAALWPAWQASRVSPLAAVRSRHRRRGAGGRRRSLWRLLGLALVITSLALLYNSTITNLLRRFMSDAAMLQGGLFIFIVGMLLLLPTTVSALQRLWRPFIALLYGREGKIGSDNVRREMGRTMSTTGTLMLGLIMLISLNIWTTSFRARFTEYIDEVANTDLIVVSPSPMPYRRVGRTIASIEGVTEVYPARYLPTTLTLQNGQEIDPVFLAVSIPRYLDEKANFIFSDEPRDVKAALRAMEDGQALLVSSFLSERHNIQIGDRVFLRTARGDKEFEVAGVEIDFTALGNVVVGSWSTLKRDFRLKEASLIDVIVAEGVNLDEVADRIEKRLGTRYNLNVEDIEHFKERNLSNIKQFDQINNMMLFIALLISALGVTNTLLMNILERQQEIGTMRALGMTRFQVGRIILSEAGTVGAIGGTLGIVGGLILSRAFLHVLGTLSGYPLDYFVPAFAIISSLVTALLVPNLAALWPAQVAARTDMITALKEERGG